MAGTLSSIRIALKSEICPQIRNRITNYEISKVFLSSKSAAEKCSKITKDNVPKNVEEFQASQKAKFSPSRNRETNSARILSKLQQPASAFGGNFMSDQKSHESKSGKSSHLAEDIHVGAYDCNNAVSLSSVVYGNVPNPFKMSGNNAPAQYNMQGGQACQGDKYIAGDLHDHHHLKSSSKGSKVE